MNNLRNDLRSGVYLLLTVILFIVFATPLVIILAGMIAAMLGGSHGTN